MRRGRTRGRNGPDAYMAPTLTDGVVVLRPMVVGDAAAHLAGEDELMVRFLSGGVSSLEGVKAWIEASLVEWREGGPRRVLGVFESVSDRLAGMVEANLALPGLRDGVVNLSYGLHPWARGRGFATRALRLLVEYVRGLGGVWAAVVQLDPENAASRRVGERAGFRFVGLRVSGSRELFATYVLRWE